MRDYLFPQNGNRIIEYYYDQGRYDRTEERG